MSKNTFLVMREIVIEEQPKLSLEELCVACHVTPDDIQDMVDFGVIDVENNILETYEFDMHHLRRVRTAIHLQQDLEVNLAGAALVLDLMDEVEQLRTQVALLEKQLKF